MKISTDSPKPGFETYQATLQLDGIELENPDGGPSRTIDHLDLKDVTVGWFAG
jgi:hypothetical protein